MSDLAYALLGGAEHPARRFSHRQERALAKLKAMQRWLADNPEATARARRKVEAKVEALQQWLTEHPDTGSPEHRGTRGPFGPRKRRGARARRGDVRAALLALLAEQPRHGYELIQELSERTQGLWRPSPGSVYPTLAQLEDEGLVKADEAEGKRIFRLTDAGRAEVEARSGPAPWDELNEIGGGARADLFREMALVVAAVKQFRHVGGAAQHEAAVRLLAETRRGLYRILAEDDLDSE